MKNEKHNFEPDTAKAFRRRVLAWVNTMHDNGTPVWHYRMFKGSDVTIYSSCFALHLRHLLDDLGSENEQSRQDWVNYIQGFQNPESGLFEDPNTAQRTTNPNHDRTHLSRQLTTFCVSALDCLQAKARHPLCFVNEWYRKDHLLKWLEGLNWSNPWNSGNKVMFVAICLIYNYENFRDDRAREALDVWFDWMDATQKPSNGFWGHTRKSDYFSGMGGFYHQYVIYNYMRRPVHYEERVVDTLLRLQQSDGLFFPGNGGGSCDDIDGIDPLVHSYHRTDYRRSDIRKALKQAMMGLLANQNSDGGFCWANRNYFSAGTYWNLLLGHLGRLDPYYWYYCNRKFFGRLYKFKGVVPLTTGWTKHHRTETQSSLFDTWIRCTSLGEICTVLTDGPLSDVQWKFLKTPGLGWFERQNEAGSSKPALKKHRIAA